MKHHATGSTKLSLGVVARTSSTLSSCGGEAGEATLLLLPPPSAPASSCVASISASLMAASTATAPCNIPRYVKLAHTIQVPVLGSARRTITRVSTDSHSHACEQQHVNVCSRCSY